MPIKTKIICTIGPSVNNYEMIVALIKAGMNVARLNFSHGTHAEHKQSIDLLKEVRTDLGVPLAIMLDTKGPEIRLRKIGSGEVYLPQGHTMRLIKNNIEGNEHEVAITPPDILDCLQPGFKILFDDGYISANVIDVNAEGVTIKIHNGGVLRSGKGVNIPEAALNLPTLTEQDIEDIKFGCKEDVDFIAASFVRSAEDVLEIKNLLEKERKGDILVIAKIENREGVQNFASIVQVADGIMIARGDLGVQVPLSQVPRLQKMMIRQSYLVGKPAVTATQMLESMINNPRPTRAEASDVANAIYDSTSAVMLSGETAVGKYPVEVVTVMNQIVEEAENDFDYRGFFDRHAPLVYNNVPSAVTLATVKTAYSLGAKAIFAFTTGGVTARLLSRLRPSMPIIAMTSDKKCYHQLAFEWGVIPVLGGKTHNIHEALKEITEHAMELKYVVDGDLVVVNAGAPFGISGTTNMMQVEIVGDVLARGSKGFGAAIHGNVVYVRVLKTTPSYAVHNQIIVITQCDESYMSLIKETAGVILANERNDKTSEMAAISLCQKFNKPLIVGAYDALSVVKEGQLVTIVPDKALIYKGVVL